MQKVIVFDLYDTVLKDISFDFEAGIDYLYNEFFVSVCTWKELIEYTKSFLTLYEKRNVDLSEVCLIKDEIPLLFEKFGVCIPQDMEALEYEIMSHMQKVTLLDEVRYTLKELYKQGKIMYILSNSIFTEIAARKLLDEFGVLQYFTKVYSSADYGIRKPSAKFFQIAIEEIMVKFPKLKKKDILYVGNDYITDVKGAASYGLRTVWYNVKHNSNKDNVDVVDIDDFAKLLELSK